MVNIMTYKTWAQSILLEFEELVEDGDHKNSQHIPSLIPFYSEVIRIIILVVKHHV